MFLAFHKQKPSGHDHLALVKGWDMRYTSTILIKHFTVQYTQTVKNTEKKLRLELTFTTTYRMTQKRLMLALYTVKSVNTARVPRSIHSLLLRSAIVARLKLRFVPRFWVKPPPAYRARDPGWVEPSNSSEVWKFQLWKKNRTNHIQNLTSHEYAHVYVTNVWLETFRWLFFTFLYKGRKMTKESKSVTKSLIS